MAYALTVLGELSLLGVSIVGVLLSRDRANHWPIPAGAVACLFSQLAYVFSLSWGVPRLSIGIWLLVPIISAWMTMAATSNDDLRRRFRKSQEPLGLGFYETHPVVMRWAFRAASLISLVVAAFCSNRVATIAILVVPGMMLLFQVRALWAARHIKNITFKVVVLFSIGDMMFLLGRLVEAPWWIANVQAVIVNCAVISLQARAIGRS